MSAARTLERLQLLLGTWKGHGEGRFPTIDPFRYEELLVFRHREGTDYLTYEQTAHLVDGQGRFLEPSHWEAGAIRAEDDGALTLSSAHDSLRVEVMRGTVEEDADDLLIRLDSVLHANDPRMRGSAREIRLSRAELTYTMNMATQNTPQIQTHLRARLGRV